METFSLTNENNWSRTISCKGLITQNNMSIFLRTNIFLEMSTVDDTDKSFVNFGWNFSNYFQIFLIIWLVRNLLVTPLFHRRSLYIRDL